MKTTCLRFLVPVLLIAGTATPAFSQSATKFSGFLCQIDLRALLPVFPGLPAQFQRTESTLVSKKTCAGVASARNAKIECQKTIAGWRQANLGNRSVTSLFECTINGDVCDLDPNTQLVNATQTQLFVDSAGKAKLTCFFKP